jgi:hypothetical protein
MVCLLPVSSDVPQCWHCLQGTRLIPSALECLRENYVMHSLYSQWNKLVIHESLLCREWKVIGTTMSSFQAIVPLTQRRTVLSHCHDIRPSGHLEWMTWGTPNRVTTSSTIILATVPASMFAIAKASVHFVKYVSDNHKDWDRQLPYVMMAYRTTAHETTGFSPNMLMLGRETSTPLDLCMICGSLFLPQSTSYKTSESFPKMLNGPLQNDVNFGVHLFFF